MSELAKLLRLQAPADKEIVTTRVQVLATISGERFESQLTLGYARKRLYVYNATAAGSGEVYFGPAGVTTATGVPIEKGDYIELPIGTDLDVYFVASSITGVNIRVVELA